MKNVKVFFLAFLVVFSMDTIVSAYQMNFIPRSSVSMEYTDNIFLSGEDKEDEFTTIVSVGFTLDFLEKTHGLEISYDPSYVFYDRFDENDTLRHDANLYAWTDIGKNTRLEFTDRFLFTEDPLGESDLMRDDQVVIPGDTTIRRSRNEYYTNTAIMRLNQRFGFNNNAYAEFLHSFLRNDDPSIDDNDRYQPAIGLNYWFGPKLEYGIETRGAYTKGKFSRDDDSLESSTDDFDEWYGSVRLIRNMSRQLSFYARYEHTYRDYEGINENDYKLYMPSLGVEYQFDQSFGFVFGLGYYQQDVDDADNEDGFFGSGELRKNWAFKRGNINLSGQAGLRANDFGAQQLGVERFASVAAEATYNFTRNLSGNIIGRFSYSDPINTDETDSIDNQKQYAGSAGLNYLPFRWMTLSLRYQHTRLDSDVEGDAVFAGRTDEDYRENRVMFMVVLQADPPWRF